MNKLLNKAFVEIKRWEEIIEKGVLKDIDKGILRDMCSPHNLAKMYVKIKDGNYKIIPPHAAEIPKDDGTMRTVYANEPIDRLLLSVTNNLLFDVMPELINPACKSYQKGIGCGKIVQEVVQKMCTTSGEIKGFKADLSKYFDSVPIKYIDDAFKKVTNKYGDDALIDMLVDYYHSDLYFDINNEIQKDYKSLKQGCAVAAWLADVVLKELDDELSSLKGYYVRYSDDLLFIGDDYDKAMDILEDKLAEMNMKLNPKKVEYIKSNTWFTFLGFSINGSTISLSKNRLIKFEKQVRDSTINKKDMTYDRALHNINKILYKGDGVHSWATQILPIITSESDLIRMDNFVKDCLRAVITNKKRLYGLGYCKQGNGKDGVIPHENGKNVGKNKEKIPWLNGYNTIMCMQKALLTSREAYEIKLKTM